MMVRFKKGSVFIGVLGILIFVIAPAIFGESMLYSHTFTGTWESSFHYLPEKTPDPGIHSYGSGTAINSATDLQTWPYPIPIRYSASINTETLWPTDTRPYIKFTQCYPNGATDGNVILNLNNEGQSVTNRTYLLPANRGILINVYTGAFNMSFGNFGGFKCWYQIEFQLDPNPPQTPGAPMITNLGTGSVYNNVYHINTNTLDLQWTPVDDYGTMFYGEEVKAGIKEYIISLHDSGTISQAAASEGDQNTITGVLIPTQGKIYGFSVQARDKANNTSAGGDEINVMYDGTRPRPISGFTASPVNDSYTKANAVTLTWNSTVDEIGVLKEYQVSADNGVTWTSTGLNTGYNLQDLTDGATYHCKVKAVDYAGNESYESTVSFTVDRSAPDVTLPDYPGKFTGDDILFTWNPAADPSGIKEYQVALTENAIEPAVWETVTTSQNGIWSKTFSDRSAANTYYLWVRAIDNLGNPGPWTRTDPFPAFEVTGPTDDFVTKNTTHHFNVTNRYPIQGDEIRYRVCYQRSSGIEPGNTGALRSGPQSVTFPADGAWNWWIELSEFKNGSEIAESRQTTAPFGLAIDSTPPGGGFTIKSITGEKTYSGDLPSNTPEVLICDIQLSDTGPAASGVKGIYLWNGESAARPADAIYFPVAEIPAGGIPWTLSLGADGARVVTMQVLDNAGNETEGSSLAAYRLTLDTTAPGTPVVDGCSYPNGILQFNFHLTDKDHDFSNFYLKSGPGIQPLDPAGILYDEGTNTYHGKYTASANPGPNQPVTVTVFAVDRAGNLSAEIAITGFTRAALGTLFFIEDHQAARKQLKWRLNYQPGAAMEYRLEFGDAIPDTIPVEVIATYPFASIGYLALPNTTAGEGVFVLDSLPPDNRELTAHAYYQCRLVALNQNGASRTESEIFVFQVPNLYPGKPVLNPIQWANLNRELAYQNAADPDGDDLKYTIRWRETGSAVEYQLPGTKVGEMVPAPLHGKTYTWYVQADDSHGGVTKSEPGSFTVDTMVPRITAAQPAYPSGQKQLTLTVTDDLSGISHLSYKKIDPETNQEETGTIDLSITGAGLTGTGTLDLEQGAYHLHFTAWDRAGNQSEATQFNHLMIDHTRPELSELQLGLISSGGRYLTGTGKVPVSFTAMDDFSGVKYFRYWLLENQWEPLGTGKSIPLSPGRSNYAYTLDLDGESGRDYYLALAIEDQAGNYSTVHHTGPIRIDRTAPEVALILEGLTKYGAGNYLANFSGLKVNLNVHDPESALTETKLAILDAAGEPISGWGDWATVSSTPLTGGAKYRVAVQAVNEAQLTSQKVSEEFLYDPTGPQLMNFNGPTGRLATGEPALFEITAAEPESSIVSYRLAIAALDDPEEILTVAVPGSEPGGWLAIPPGGPPVRFRVELPEGRDGVYYPVLEITNAAGLETIWFGERFVLDNLQEKVVVSDQGPFTMFSDQLTGWWRYTGNQPLARYQYRIVDMNYQVIHDWETTEETMMTVTGLELNSAASYRFEVRAVFSDGSYSSSGFSPGVSVDLTPPELTKLVVPEYCATSDLKVEWAGEDLESGIGRVWAALGSGFKQTDITGGWVVLAAESSYLTADLSGNPLQLETGRRYYLTLRAINGAGLITEIAAPGIMIDNTPPPAPVVRDQGAYLNTAQPLKANWIWSPADPESGPNTYQWAIFEFGADLGTAIWHDTDDLELALTDFRQEHGHTYYFAVRATNGAGLSSVGLSDGIKIDSTAPYLAEVKLLNAINLGDPEAAGVNYITSNQNLALAITGQDAENTPIDNYLYAWGEAGEVGAAARNQSPTGRILLEDPQLEPGVITLFVAECMNGSQLVSDSGYSSGVLLDPGAPKVVNVHGGAAGNLLLFDWDVITSAAPVAYYEISLVKAEDAGKIPTVWENAGLKRSLLIDGSNYPDGEYCLLIRAANQAGTVSRRQGATDEWGTSPVIILDRTAPEITGFHCSPYASAELAIQLEASDNLSGIGGYQYALGSKTNPLEYSGGWIDIHHSTGQLAYRIPTGGIGQLNEAYLIVRVKDRAGLWSKPRLSQKIVIDHTPPGKPVVTCGQYTTSKSRIAGIEFSSSDQESGITHFKIGVVRQPGDGEWLFAQIRPISEFNGGITGLDLADAGVYYLAVQTQNGAGDWSETGYSNPVTVDITPPEFIFTRAGEEIVINQPPLAVEYSLSETAKTEFTLTSGNGDSRRFTITGQSGTGWFNFTENFPDTYRLTAAPVDPAGNVGAPREQIIRVNAPPRIVLREIETTPGKPVILSAEITDPDGQPGATYQYRWDPGDGGAAMGDSTPEYRYTALGDFTLTLTVTDSDGGVAVATVPVKVRNTVKGVLYQNETWSGTHRIYGDLTVPSGLTLTILPGTEVIIDGVPGSTGYNHSLIVKGKLTVGVGTRFRSVNGTPTNGWKGIVIEGEALLEGVTLENAHRGLVATRTANVTVTDCVFADNYIGVHACGGNVVIQNSAFRRNLWYGVKEDLGGEPLVIDCRFEQNEMNYYDETLTEITMEQLNAMPGNRGNR